RVVAAPLRTGRRPGEGAAACRRRRPPPRCVPDRRRATRALGRVARDVERVAIVERAPPPEQIARGPSSYQSPSRCSGSSPPHLGDLTLHLPLQMSVGRYPENPAARRAAQGSRTPSTPRPLGP